MGAGNLSGKGIVFLHGLQPFEEGLGCGLNELQFVREDASCD